MTEEGSRMSLDRRRGVGAVVITFCTLGACSIQDFDRLERGSATGTGGKSNPGGSAGASVRVAADAGATTGGRAMPSGGNAGSVAPNAGIAAGGSIETTIATTIQAGGGSLGAAGTGSAGTASCDRPLVADIRDVSGPVSGLGMVTVPLKAVGQGTRVNYQDYTGVGSYNLTCASMTIVACAPDAIGGDLHIYFTTTKRADSVAFNVPLSELTSGWKSITVPVPGKDEGGFDPADIMVTRLEIEAASEFGTTWQTPATIVYFDSIRTSTGQFYDTFDGSSTRLQTSGARFLDGSSLTWLREIPPRTGSGGTTSVGAAGATNSAGSSGSYSGWSGTAGVSSGAGTSPLGGNAGARS